MQLFGKCLPGHLLRNLSISSMHKHLNLALDVEVLISLQGGLSAIDAKQFVENLRAIG
ncbi:hypothetical protein BTN50_1639 (plasmid) [Candidatus Enterovibrio altilux]|uniref:Uncharacterized protein n=1 Tax=Candidatus Enterovibrio altilux TaxID=1927128 RepID=A0A291BAQ4_9GAMM|nr:hypothetical protein BTN50_1639 [Candidatus Enterovibrio luxaltus]